uniref:Epstein-Barr virus EBNA-1-like protein n=1 Tax=Oryza sativa subsp. japonica TaxID=39947 RepID=Q84YZ6_ORYSJ|nr:Epstein-Barr virus EBNA-1-like protein [Oryza sativa Japonica Group]
MTLLTRIIQPVGISHVGRPPSFHDKAFRKPTQVYHMPTRGVPDQQQVRSQTILCQEAQGSSPTPPRRIHMSLGIKAPPISNLLSQGRPIPPMWSYLSYVRMKFPRKRSLSARAGNRTPDFKFEGDRRYLHRVHEYRGATGWLQGDMAELVPTWRLRGGHVGWREVDDDPAANGRRVAAASGGANHGDTGKSEHTGRLHGTRGDEPTARIRRRLLDGGGLRRRQPAAGEEENGNEVTRGRFPAVRASTRLRELDASVGLGGTTPSEAGDERVLRSSGGDGGEHTASDGNGRGGTG